MGWTSKETADYLGVSKSFVARLCREGVLRCTMHGRDWDIEPDSVKEYAERPKEKVGRKPKKLFGSF